MGRHNNQKNILKYKGFLHIPHVIMMSERFTTLHPRSVKLLLDIAMQYRGGNNGDLQATMSLMKYRGWTSNHQLTDAKKQLLDNQLIVKTRQGGLGMSCDLFALSWQPINECGGKLDVASTTNPPVSWLKEEKELAEEGTLYRIRKPRLKSTGNPRMGKCYGKKQAHQY